MIAFFVCKCYFKRKLGGFCIAILTLLDLGYNQRSGCRRLYPYRICFNGCIVVYGYFRSIRHLICAFGIRFLIAGNEFFICDAVLDLCTEGKGNFIEVITAALIFHCCGYKLASVNLGNLNDSGLQNISGARICGSVGTIHISYVNVRSVNKFAFQLDSECSSVDGICCTHRNGITVIINELENLLKLIRYNHLSGSGRNFLFNSVSEYLFSCAEIYGRSFDTVYKLLGIIARCRLVLELCRRSLIRFYGSGRISLICVLIADSRTLCYCIAEVRGYTLDLRFCAVFRFYDEYLVGGFVFSLFFGFYISNFGAHLCDLKVVDGFRVNILNRTVIIFCLCESNLKGKLFRLCALFLACLGLFDHESSGIRRSHCYLVCGMRCSLDKYLGLVGNFNALSTVFVNNVLFEFRFLNAVLNLSIKMECYSLAGSGRLSGHIAIFARCAFSFSILNRNSYLLTVYFDRIKFDSFAVLVHSVCVNLRTIELSLHKFKDVLKFILHFYLNGIFMEGLCYCVLEYFVTICQILMKLCIYILHRDRRYHGNDIGIVGTAVDDEFRFVRCTCMLIVACFGLDCAVVTDGLVRRFDQFIKSSLIRISTCRNIKLGIKGHSYDLASGLLQLFLCEVKLKFLAISRQSTRLDNSSCSVVTAVVDSDSVIRAIKGKYIVKCICEAYGAGIIGNEHIHCIMEYFFSVY